MKQWIWFAVLVFTCALVSCSIWFLYLNPHSISLFWASIVVSLSFVIVMALLPKFRQQVIKWVLAYNTRQKEIGGRLYPYQGAAFILAITCTLTLLVVWQYQLIPMQYMPLVFFTLLSISLISGAILIGGFVKSAGKWGALIVAVIATIAIIRFLIGIR